MLFVKNNRARTLGMAVLLFLLGPLPSIRGQETGADRKIRVISLAPATTEILFALGMDQEIVGVSQFCDYPETAKTKEKIGTFSSPDIEKIIFLKPDVIFGAGLEQAETVQKLRQLGFKVFISDPKNFEELFSSISLISENVRRTEAAQKLIAEMKKGIQRVRESVPQGQKKKVFIELWHDPLLTAGRSSFLHELIALAGGENIAQDISKPYAIVGPELVIARDPDCIILAYMQATKSRKSISRRFGWKNISAVRTGRVVSDINPDILLRPGPRVLEALEKIRERLYPNE